MLSAIASFTNADVVSAFGGACINPSFGDYTLSAVISSLAPFGILLVSEVIHLARHVNNQVNNSHKGVALKIYGQHMEVYLLVTYCVLPLVFQLLLQGKPLA